MYCIKKHILISFLLCTVAGVCTQGQTNRLDSLRAVMLSPASIAEQQHAVISIYHNSFSLSTDSMQRYAILGERLFPAGSRTYLQMKNFYCMYLFKAGKMAEGFILIDSLMQYISVADTVTIEIISNRCAGLIRNGKNKEAIAQSFGLLETAERMKDTLGVIKSYTFLGWANMELEQYKDAIKWLTIAIRYSNNPLISQQACAVYANIASCYNNINKPDSAFYFIELALKYSRLDQNLTSLANSLNIRADMYLNKHDYPSAENDMKEALIVRQHIGEQLYIISDMAQLSSFYASTGQTAKGIDIARQGIELARKSNNLSKLIFLYNALAENYKKAGQPDNYAASLQAIIQLKDSLYKENSENAIAEMATKYELQKKENIIMRQYYQITRNRYTTIGSSVLFVLGLLFVWVLYRNYKLVQQRKMEAAMAEQKILSYKAVEQAQEDERKRIAADLHDNLGSFAAAITANVKNLKDGSDTDADAILSQLEENAQNMVTQLGDTIWVLKNEQLPITKLADRFKAWVQRLIQNYPQVKYHYSENIIDDIEFSPSGILQIFLILKECINNALKHSNCSDLKIGIESGKGWMVTIEDNGIGFDHIAISTRDGINNIRKRAAECGWDVAWEKLSPAGTRVVISGTTTN